MLLRTHIAITFLFILLIIGNVNNKIIFLSVALISTLIPDIDTRFSVLGKRRVFRILQFFVRHRKMFHSLIFCLIITSILVLFVHVLALGFFLGYGLHLFADSFTIEGIIPFYPFGKRSSWRIRTGAKTETILFLSVFAIDFLLLVYYIFGFF